MARKKRDQLRCPPVTLPSLVGINDGSPLLLFIYLFIFIFFLRDFIFKKTLFEKLQYLKQEQ